MKKKLRRKSCGAVPSSNARMPEYWEKVSPASAFLLVVNCVNPAMAFRSQGQSGTAGHGLVWHCCSALSRDDEFCE